ncbi:MAG: DnaJ domain-containing protein [Thermomicrobiales bacterium]|nr:DnaJ domain-containing protein [Thermomicrobiales bacterium]
MLPIIGARDYIEPLGYVLFDCPQCQRERVFSIYETKRKLTLYFVPTMNVRSQAVMECTACHNRWGIPDNEKQAVFANIMTQEQVTQRMLRAQIAAMQPPRQPPRARTYYQILQVDQEAERDVIEAAFRRLAIKYHPDTSEDPAAAMRMREILEARDLLLDETRRRQYDASLGIVRYVEALRPGDV